MFRATIFVETDIGKIKFFQCFKTETECHKWLYDKSEQAKRLKLKTTSFSIDVV